MSIMLTYFLFISPMQKPNYALIELFFFAYRDFTGDADLLLEEYAFGRAHHRVLHFVHRNEGLAVAEVLEILRITKQSLGRVLRDLIDKGFIEQREGAQDRRQRLLFLTSTGQDLALKLSQLQSKRIDKALTEAHLDETTVKQFLYNMINKEEREMVVNLLKER